MNLSGQRILNVIAGDGKTRLAWNITRDGLFCVTLVVLKS